jgi:hypothetical protein
MILKEGQNMRSGTIRRAVTLAALAILVLGCKRDSAKAKADADDDDDESTTAAASAVPPSENAAQGAGMAWHFDSMAAGGPPAGFALARTGSGRPGSWVIRAAPDAPSGPNVLAQEDSDRTDYRFPVAVADVPVFGDVSVSVRCKPVAGHVDQACGIVWRYQDENNYYLARANALEDNVCWYYVQNGRRIEVKRVRIHVASGVWHTLRADMVGDHIEVYFNHQKLIDVHDSRFTAPGKVGVWTKADSRTLFDDLTAQAIRSGT